MSNIREVAKRAGVSTATVSRVLSRPDVVSPDTRLRVLKAVERLGYAPNSVAKNLRTLRSCKLLVTVPDISNPFFALILQGIEDAAQKNGYAVRAILPRPEGQGLSRILVNKPRRPLRRRASQPHGARGTIPRAASAAYPAASS